MLNRSTSEIIQNSESPTFGLSSRFSPSLTVAERRAFSILERVMKVSEPIGEYRTGNYLFLHRQLLEHPIFVNPTLCHFWIYCLIKATWKAKKILWGSKEIELEAGEFIFGRKKASKETGLTEQQIRTALQKFAKLKMLEKSTTKSTTNFTVIRVVNWLKYQISNEGGNHQNNRAITTDQPPSNHRVTTYNKDNKEKKEKIKEKLFVPTQQQLGLCAVLVYLIKQNAPDYIEPKSKITWAKYFDKMIRLDKRIPSEIVMVMNFAQSESFWKSNVLSPGKLREQWTKLTIKMQELSDAGKYPQLWHIPPELWDKVK